MPLHRGCVLKSSSMNTRDSVDAAKIQQLGKLGNRELLMPDLPGSWPEVLSLEDLPNS